MLKGSEKVSFRIYKESGCDRPCQIVYVTELDKHERDAAMSRSVEGETIDTGFLKEACLDQSKQFLAVISLAGTQELHPSWRSLSPRFLPVYTSDEADSP